jgi:hypothetical protein
MGPILGADYDRNVRVTVLLLLLLVLLLAAPATAVRQSGTSGPRTVFFKQAGLFRQGKYRVMYETTYTANYRRHCSWRQFKRGQSAFKRYLGPGYTIHNVRVRRLSAKRALLTYQFLHRSGTNALTVTARQHDLYSKIGRRWYDDYNGNAC